MAYAYVWTTAGPVGTDLVSEGATEIREGVKAALNERLLTVFADLDDDPLKYKDIQFDVNNTRDIGTTAARAKAGYFNGLAINLAVAADAGAVLLANATGAIKARNAADSANLVMLHMSAGDVLQLYNGAATLTAAGVLAATTFSGAFSGNATTATALATARTIWGQNFDGSANVSGALSGATSITNSTYIRLGTGNDASANDRYAQLIFSRSATLGSGASVDFQLPESTGKANFGLLIISSQRPGSVDQCRVGTWLVGFDGTTAPIFQQVGTDLVNGTAGNSTYTVAGLATGQVRITSTSAQTNQIGIAYFGQVGL